MKNSFQNDQTQIITNNNYKYAYLIGFISIILNTVLFAGKFAVGLKINSIALISDAWHTLSDTLTSVIMILGIFLSTRPPDKEHPFGHGRVEKITTLIIGLVLVFVGINFLKESITRIITGKIIIFTFLSVLVQAVCAFSKQVLSILSFLTGKKQKIQALIADAWHHQSDVITSYLFLIGAALQKHIPLVDGYLGIIISIAILITAIDIIKSSTSPLIGEEIPEDLKESIVHKVNELDGRINDLHHFHYHRYGNHIEVTFHIRLPNSVSLEEAHEITQKIEMELLKDNINATIHIEPYIET